MKRVGIIVILVLGFIGGWILMNSEETVAPQTNPSPPPQTMQLTLAAPRVDDPYYEPFYDDVVAFQVAYAQAIQAHGKDTVQILADQATIDRFDDQLQSGTFIEQPMLDIWMRDFTLVGPNNPVQFQYTDASMSADEARQTQSTFSGYLSTTQIQAQNTDLILDGGNIVDDFSGRVITTTRFLEDNSLSYEDGKQQLREVLGANEVAIIEPDDEVLAHADGMVAWIDDNVLAVNDYSETDPLFHQLLMDELETAFPSARFVLVPVVFEEGGDDPDLGIGSACGVNLNLVATPTTLYVPTFGVEHDQAALQAIKDNTQKDVIEINAQNVCRLGGSARCTVWQLFKESR